MANHLSRAPLGLRDGRALSADNGLPERHIVMETLRRAAAALSLKPPVLATLDAMLSCLAPKRNHNIVFASNATLVFRRNGLSDRSLRRHVQTLIETGLISRLDSANGKRFTKTNSRTGTVLRFGFDLSPLFHRFAEIAALAATADQAHSHIAHLRSRIRAALQQLLRAKPDHRQALELVKHLRRKLTVNALTDLLETLPAAGDISDIIADKTADLATKDGHNDRHHHKANKENIETTAPVEKLDLETIMVACPETAELSPHPIQTADDIIRHGEILAPMLGIDRKAWIRAENRFGPLGTALTIWAIVQQQGKIARGGAYFQAVTTGQQSGDFNPFKWINRMARQAQRSANAAKLGVMRVA